MWQAAGIAQSTTGRTSIGNGQRQRQAKKEQNPWAKSVLYTPRATTVDGRLSELDEYNPGLSNIIAARPLMLGPGVALLCFPPTASIPQHLMVFGKNQVPTMDKEKAPRTGRTSAIGGSVHTSVDTPPGSINTPASSINAAPGGSSSGNGGGGRGDNVGRWSEFLGVQDVTRMTTRPVALWCAGLENCWWSVLYFL